MSEGPKRPYDQYKRMLDVICAAAGIVITGPVQLVIAFLVWRQMGRPILFRQPRPGRNAEVFTMVKFRTMSLVGADKGAAADDGSRLNHFGSVLRRSSLDELPTLWNVLRGDMSLIGPRPLLTQYLPRYTPDQARRHEVRPGVTGLAQVSGRNNLSWDEKFAADIRYVDERGLKLDLGILLRTMLVVLCRQGISAHGEATMPEFIGPTREHIK